MRTVKDTDTVKGSLEALQLPLEEGINQSSDNTKVSDSKS